MAAYGYDGRHLFKLDESISYEGETSTPPTHGVHLVGDEGMATRFTGSYFLSGVVRPALNVWADGKTTAFVLSHWTDGEIRHEKIDNIGAISHVVPICLNGPVVNSPTFVAEFCRSFPSSSIFVCPIDQELSALGAVVKNKKPYRAYIPSPQVGDMPYESQEYDPKLEDDKYGRMADLVAKGIPVYNNIYSGPGGGPFYGSVLTMAPHPEMEMYIVNSESMQKYFPTDPISAKYYAATTVPVIMSPSEECKDIAGSKQDKMSVMASSSFAIGMTTFMNFYKICSGRDWCSMNPARLIAPNKTLPLFQYDKAYRVTASEYFKMIMTKNEQQI